MDVNMPKMSGIEASKKIRLLFPDIKILGLTMSDDADSVSEMMRAGALGYLLKTTSKAELISAIVHVNNGEKYLSAEMSMKLIEKCLMTMKRRRWNAFPGRQILLSVN